MTLDQLPTDAELLATEGLTFRELYHRLWVQYLELIKETTALKESA